MMSTESELRQDDTTVQQCCALFDEMRQSISSVRDVVKTLQEKLDKSEINMSEGISLLSTKAQVLLSYLQSLSLLSARRALGHSLLERLRPDSSFASSDRGVRGDGAGDRVDAMIEERLILEKIKVLEGRMRYQIEKLVRVAEESPEAAQNVVNDPLAFKPNPQNLVNNEMSGDEGEANGTEDKEQERDGIYRPPKLAPMPYVEPAKKDKKRRAPVPTALATLTHLDPSMPHVESTSGLGFTPALMSGRAKELQRMTEFEEENMTRLVMKKKDARKRKQDEADLALGGTGITGRHGRGGGLESEFSDIFRSVGRSRTAVTGDGYEELRQKGKKQSVLARSRVRPRDDVLDVNEGPRQRKRTRFDQEVKAAKKRLSAKSKRS